MRPRNIRGAAATIICTYSILRGALLVRTCLRTSLSANPRHENRSRNFLPAESRCTIPRPPLKGTKARAERRTTRFVEPDSGRPSISGSCVRQATTPGVPPCSKQIATFLCGRHFLRAFSSRNHPACNARSACGLAHHVNQNTVVRSLSQAFRSPTETTDAPRGGSHGCLTRHHIAPSLRKSAACTSSHGPVWLFFLRCG